MAFLAERDGEEKIYWQAADGSGVPESLTEILDVSLFPTGFSPDAKQLLLTQPRSEWDIFLLNIESGEIEELLSESFREGHGEISPDGQWLAYQSDESGQFEVYVRPYPEVGNQRQQISTGGGEYPVWSKNGQELFYSVPPGTVMAVPVETGASSISTGTPEVVVQGDYFGSSGAGRTYDVSADGQRFLMMKDVASELDELEGPRIKVVLNWFEELKELVPVD